jgi:hypothetical protein
VYSNSLHAYAGQGVIWRALAKKANVFSEVLCGSGKQELVLRACEGQRFLQLTHMLTFGFVEIARHDALYALGAALFKSASTTVFRAGAIGHGAVLAHQTIVQEVLAGGDTNAFAAASNVKLARVK